MILNAVKAKNPWNMILEQKERARNSSGGNMDDNTVRCEIWENIYPIRLCYPGVGSLCGLVEDKLM
jgi:hypothetical protein